MIKKTILIVDDEKNVIDLGSLLLSSNGYNVQTASNGEEAINHLKTAETKPNLVLLDILMPKITGYQVCKWIKQQPDLADLPVIFLTALVEENTEEEAWGSGCDDFISKPFTVKYLLSVIEKHTKELPSSN